MKVYIILCLFLFKNKQITQKNNVFSKFYWKLGPNWFVVTNNQSYLFLNIKMSFNYKMYFQYLSNVDESPATQGGKENYWRKLTLDGTYLKVQKYFFGIWGPSWSWSYDIWIYNYLCNQCLSPLTLWVRTPFISNIMW